MNKIKIIFFDVDGTLIDMSKKQLSKRMLGTLRQLKERGIVLCVATGRSPIALPQIEGVTFDAFLTFNGSYCFNETGVIHTHPIPKSDVKQIITNASKLNRPVAVATHNQTIANGKEADLEEYFSFAHQEVVVSDAFSQLVENEAIFQVMLGSGPENYAKIMEHTTETEIAAWWNRAIDIIPKMSGKGAGVAKILAHYGFDKTQALAFGDGNNDIELLKAVGWGLAMKNASDELKEVSDEIIGHVAEDGIYHYCLAKGLITEED